MRGIALAILVIGFPIAANLKGGVQNWHWTHVAVHTALTAVCVVCIAMGL